MKKKSVKQATHQIEQAVKVLQQGGIIAYPTEAVYGLGCDPANISALKKILKIKRRDKDKGLILVAATFEQLKPFIQTLPRDIEEKILVSWQESDHAVTWLVPVKENVSVYVKGQFKTLAVRVSNHPLVKELCNRYGGAIVSTSANISSEQAARTSEEVEQVFDSEVDLIIEGETDVNAQPSEIRDALTDNVIRSY